MNKDDLIFEWIKETRQDVKEIKDEMSTLKVKVATISMTVTLIMSYIYKKMGL